EAAPTAYPDAPENLSVAAAALAPEAIWQRIEAWVTDRWSPRAVTWLVEGPGEWSPPLSPAVDVTAEVWAGSEWSDVTLQAAPDGYCLSAEGPYRITATVGSDSAPEAALEAFRRLAEYSAAIGDHSAWKGPAGANSHNFNLSEGVSLSVDRTATWAARALVNSGAADLLRPYRRAA
ncbi:MAG TPA: hypothetical protein VIQ22_00825, partial [Gammaproteobacteria bacterium]